MGKYLGEYQPVTIPGLLKKKQQGEKIVMVTCYDAAFATLVDKSDVDMVLVGDSMGNVVLGFENTLPVTMQMMIHHTSSVARGSKRAFVVADMPFGSYQVSTEQAVANAVRLIQEGGAQAVKLEGGASIVPAVKAIVAAGIPVVGHLGLTPQSIHALGGYRVQGREDEGKKRLLSDAIALEAAGASFLVLELMPSTVSKEVSEALRIPTIGIGAGNQTDGQVLVMHDLLGFNEDFKPKFLKHYATLGQDIVKALNAYGKEVREKAYPGPEHSF